MDVGGTRLASTTPSIFFLYFFVLPFDLASYLSTTLQHIFYSILTDPPGPGTYT